jgi:formylglycine-generating enzyme required for sulfatase activity
VALSLAVIGFAAPAHAVTIDTVPVGNAGNPEDDENGYGAVSYDYRIGKYEVTVGQYADILNAVATTDTYALYNTNMATDLNIAGIARSGVSGSYSYSVIGSPNHPVAYVSWGDAARFANWLHHGQPVGAQDSSTTEDGAYSLNGLTDHSGLSAVTRNPGATWFIPSENEWYKAAYHKNDGATANYWDYPTSTDDAPYSDQPPGSDAPTQSNTGNFYVQDSIANGYDDGLAVTGDDNFTTNQNYLTDVGAYTLSASPYQTFDQGGNLNEWNEGMPGDTVRGVRGGSWIDDGFILLASDQALALAGGEYDTLGFRVATIPEPSTAVLAIVAGGMIYWWRKSTRPHGRRSK